ncbi:hypothetical protein COB57_04850 [Candidatus Peregrinibacteria bacterium]|nr:MAG: hypothetical protein COB57_04850 [Candidatus Peregrinibacteria bacterium]
MALVKMKKAQVVFLKSAKDDVLQFLQKQEAFQFFSGDEEGKKDHEAYNQATKKVADVSFVIDMLSPYSQEKTPFSHMLLGGKSVFLNSQVEKIANEYPLSKVVQNVQNHEIKLNHAGSRLKEVKKELHSFSHFKSVSIHLEEWKKQSSAGVVFGSVSHQNKSEFLKKLYELKTVEFIMTSSEKTEDFFYVIFEVLHKDAVKEILRNHEVSEVIFPENVAGIHAFVESLEKESRALELQIEEITKELVVCSQDLPELKACHDFFHWEKEREKIGIEGSMTEYTYMLTGWVRADALSTLQVKIEQLTQNEAAIVEIAVEQDENVPVEIENNAVFTPFETVTRIYGLPKSDELDPTPYLSLFFLIFFGFCLTDAIYGGILALLSLFVLKMMKTDKSARGFFQLIFLGGLATVVMGVLFRGYAGIEITDTSHMLYPIYSYLSQFQIFDVNMNVMKVMGFAFGLGFVQLWFGTVISGIHQWKQGNRAKAFFEQFSWTIVFALLPVYFSYAGSENPSDIAVASNIMWSLVIFLLYGLSYEEPWLLKPVKGVLFLMNELMAWLSNVLSYARLFALGLSTGVIALVFNEIAFTVGGMMPMGLDYFVIFVIIFLGHTLNIAMNTLGAFIHSARLQFVEFFGKFMEGGGTQFAPFSRKSVFVHLESDEKL